MLTELLGNCSYRFQLKRCHVPIGERTVPRPSCLHSTLLWNFAIVTGCSILSKVRKQQLCAQAGVKHKIFQSVYECLALFGKQACICTTWCDSARITAVRKCWLATFDVRKRASVRIRVQILARCRIASNLIKCCSCSFCAHGFLENFYAI